MQIDLVTRCCCLMVPSWIIHSSRCVTFIIALFLVAGEVVEISQCCTTDSTGHANDKVKLNV